MVGRYANQILARLDLLSEQRDLLVRALKDVDKESAGVVTADEFALATQLSGVDPAAGPVAELLQECTVDGKVKYVEFLEKAAPQALREIPRQEPLERDPERGVVLRQIVVCDEGLCACTCSCSAHCIEPNVSRTHM